MPQSIEDGKNDTFGFQAKPLVVQREDTILVAKTGYGKSVVPQLLPLLMHSSAFLIVLPLNTPGAEQRDGSGDLDGFDQRLSRIRRFPEFGTRQMHDRVHEGQLKVTRGCVGPETSTQRTSLEKGKLSLPTTIKSAALLIVSAKKFRARIRDLKPRRRSCSAGGRS